MDPEISIATDEAGAVRRERRRAFRREMSWSRVAIGVTIVALAGFTLDSAILLADQWALRLWERSAVTLLGRTLIGFLLASALAYQITRLGYLARFAKHRPSPAHALARAFREDAPRLAILVHSYKEEPQVIRQTLLAAALQQSPNRRVVLLIDDPPAPRDAAAAARLAAARALPGEIGALLAGPRLRCAQALDGFLRRRGTAGVEAAAETARLAALWDEAAAFLESLADGTDAGGHNEALFAERVLRQPARAHRRRARQWRAAARTAPDDLLSTTGGWRRCSRSICRASSASGTRTCRTGSARR
jgi:hypothetical protein